MASNPVFVATPNVGLAQLLPADGTNWKDLFTAGASGSKVTAIQIATDNTADRTVQLSILRGGTNYLLGSVAVPDLAGSNGSTDPAVDLLNDAQQPGLPLDNDGQHYLLLKSGDKLQVRADAAIAATKTMDFTAIGADL